MLNKNNIAQLGTILGVWAHPDDEAFGMAGLMSYAHRNGQRIVVAVATSGDAGKSADETRWPTADLGTIREQELRDSLAVFGLDELHTLGYADTTLKDQQREQGVQKIITIITEVKPDTIITFHEDGITGHDDHRTIHVWTKQAVKSLQNSPQLFCVVACRETYREYAQSGDEKFNIYFNTDKPQTYSKHDVDVCIELDDQSIADKKRALKAHASQTAHMFQSSEDTKLLMDAVGTCECYIRVI